ncbi:uncharacterized protein LY79DRAFT_569973 [Colletotrichum navitas]|uniref:Uncharacterized protein n=1 Tax=Colletotrichum navitas TaxID=681940 RepID=A0AAD8PN90_9PEZI|nr:uncharacterized protein LY79DRAFT_569973 [Colletotrichum navitas]KAK1572676.1 hypothetical protein LY79DRAFT_569973 [Colletotrichum navitas]
MSIVRSLQRPANEPLPAVPAAQTCLFFFLIIFFRGLADRSMWRRRDRKATCIQSSNVMVSQAGWRGAAAYATHHTLPRRDQVGRYTKMLRARAGVCVCVCVLLVVASLAVSLFVVTFRTYSLLGILSLVSSFSVLSWITLLSLSADSHTLSLYPRSPVQGNATLGFPRLQ